MQQIMFKGLDRRLAEFLLAEAERTGSDTIRMTHEQIAQPVSYTHLDVYKRQVQKLADIVDTSPYLRYAAVYAAQAIHLSLIHI